ncbi:MAG TPA: peptidoglycan bridge formation glycyltransferase FemA/FemB family protein [Candidatus Limnocylindrales bacterium]|nr:peptidoglycan bridge formation glycyltransferase FemA/FemB family protein [Candidatus Limnocylindrales bacterium]
MPLTVHTDLPHADWNAALSALPYAHVLQTWEWGEFKRATTGWQPLRLAFERGGQIVAMASVGVRRAGPARVMYAPKGPALDYTDAALTAAVLDHLQRLARKHGAIWLKIDPDVIAGTGVPGEPDEAPDPTGSAITAALRARGWRFSPDQVQFRNTITVDLAQPEDALLAAMGQSTRRKLRTAEKAGVVIRPGSEADLETLYALYRTTGERDGFLIRPPAYYEQAWTAFMRAGLAQPLIAEVDGRAAAAVILFAFGRTCWYFYGASSNESRDAQPNYLLQWEAMRWAKARGYAVYDFWGAPDSFSEDDRMWGVYQFKRGFHGTVTRHIGAFDYVPYPPLYKAYTELMPRMLARMRKR